MFKYFIVSILVFGVMGMVASVSITNSRDESVPLEWIVYQSEEDGDFDIYRMSTQGTAKRALTHNDSDDLRPVWIENLELIYYIGGNTTSLFASQMSIDGELLGVTDHQMPGNIYTYLFDPNDENKSVSVGETDGHIELYFVDYAADTRQQITNLNTVIWNVFWEPTGQWVYFIADGASGDSNIYRIEPRTQKLEQLTTNPAREINARLSADGSTLIFVSERRNNWDIYAMNIETLKITLLTQSPADQMFPILVPARVFMRSNQFLPIYIITFGIGLIILSINTMRYFAAKSDNNRYY